MKWANRVALEDTVGYYCADQIASRMDSAGEIYDTHSPYDNTIDRLVEKRGEINERLAKVSRNTVIKLCGLALPFLGLTLMGDYNSLFREVERSVERQPGSPLINLVDIGFNLLLTGIAASMVSHYRDVLKENKRVREEINSVVDRTRK